MDDNKKQLPAKHEWSTMQLYAVSAGTFPFHEYELDPYTAAWLERDKRLCASFKSLT
jgi:hypothetical protein